MRTTRWLIAVLAIFSLIAAACGDDDDDTEAGSAAAESDSSSEATDDSADASEDAEVAGESEEAGSDWPDTLVYGAVPAENAQTIEDYVTPQIIADELGVEIEFIQAADYAGVIEGTIAEEVDIASFGGFSYVIATGAGADLSVAGLWAGDDPSSIGDYRSYLITQPGSEVNTVADLRGKKVCFVDPGSTSGFLFPSALLLAEGIDPSETSTDIEATFAGGHDASALAVANGDCDAGFAYDTMVTEQLIESGDIGGVIDEVEDETVNGDSADLRIIDKSAPIAAPPLAVGNWLPESMQEAIIEIVTTKVNVDWATENGYCESVDNCPLS
ncbi:MAG: phosphate/phosphite/phosphonate ABC transporter substrate-binding protein, partial [Actinomycetota bacterium]